VALRPDSVSTRPDLGPWVAALHVLPPFRGQGVGGQLIVAAEAVARRLGVPTLYAGSGRAAPLFVRCGWRALGTIPYHGETITLLRRDLADAGGDASAV
jgi:GNAT superfamily N-acetyltransferase